MKRHPEFQSRLDAIIQDPTVSDTVKHFINTTLVRQEERIYNLCRKQKAHIKSIRQTQASAEHWKFRFELSQQKLNEWMHPDYTRVAADLINEHAQELLKKTEHT